MAVNLLLISSIIIFSENTVQSQEILLIEQLSKATFVETYFAYSDKAKEKAMAVDSIGSQNSVPQDLSGISLECTKCEDERSVLNKI